jgi:hypothetical protein
MRTAADKAANKNTAECRLTPARKAKGDTQLAALPESAKQAESSVTVNSRSDKGSLPSMPLATPWSEPASNSPEAPAKVAANSMTPANEATRPVLAFASQPEATLPPPPHPDVLPPPPESKTVLQPSKLEEVVVTPERPAPVPPPHVASNAPTVASEPVVSAPAASRDDDRTLSGEVQQFRRGWRLRYAAVDVADPHGGSVGLLGPGLDQLKEGARVRVTGTLIPGDDRPGAARFQVRTLEVLDN